jgi:hypothetical protein
MTKSIKIPLNDRRRFKIKPVNHRIRMNIFNTIIIFPYLKSKEATSRIYLEVSFIPTNPAVTFIYN